MELRKAAENTITMVRKNQTGDLMDRALGQARQEDDGRGVHHALWMLLQVASGEISGEKGHRWLGYAQGVLCQMELITLDDCKYSNVLS